MTNPAFNDPFSAAYDQVALHQSELPAHAGCNVYEPDNHDDYQCIAVWQPAPELGALTWTRGGQRIMLGLYRDEGRAAQRMPMTAMTWTRQGPLVTVTCLKPHYLAIGAEVELGNLRGLHDLSVAAVLSADRLTFTVSITPVIGPASGAAFYTPLALINFLTDYIIFRLLPSFRPISVATALQIIEAANPELARAPVSLMNLTTGSVQTVSEVAMQPALQARSHRQQLDELNKPLRQLYDARGLVIPTDARFSKTANIKRYASMPLVNQHDPVPTSNAALPAYDFYGFELNDPARGPFYSSSIISYDGASSDGIARAVNNGHVIHSGFIHDVFGDYVVGARANNTLITRKSVQPVVVDQHNTPFKRPSKVE